MIDEIVEGVVDEKPKPAIQQKSMITLEDRLKELIYVWEYHARICNQQDFPERGRYLTICAEALKNTIKDYERYKAEHCGQDF